MNSFQLKSNCFKVETYWMGEWVARGEWLTKAAATDLELDLVRNGEMVRVFVVGKEIES